MTARDITDTLAQLRRDLGITQRDLAAGIGVATSAVGHWEAGDATPTLPHAAEWARQLGVTLTVHNPDMQGK